MTEFEREILKKVTDLESLILSLRSDISISRMTYFENLSPDAVVGVDYVAYRFNCSESAVVRGRFRTDEIPRTRQKPLAFIKRNVDAIWKTLNKSTAEKAAEIRKTAAERKRRKKS